MFIKLLPTSFKFRIGSCKKAHEAELPKIFSNNGNLQKTAKKSIKSICDVFGEDRRFTQIRTLWKKIGSQENIDDNKLELILEYAQFPQFNSITDRMVLNFYQKPFNESATYESSAFLILIRVLAKHLSKAKLKIFAQCIKEIIFPFSKKANKKRKPEKIVVWDERMMGLFQAEENIKKLLAQEASRDNKIIHLCLDGLCLLFEYKKEVDLPFKKALNKHHDHLAMVALMCLIPDNKKIQKKILSHIEKYELFKLVPVNVKHKKHEFNYGRLLAEKFFACSQAEKPFLRLVNFDRDNRSYRKSLRVLSKLEINTNLSCNHCEVLLQFFSHINIVDPKSEGFLNEFRRVYKAVEWKYALPYKQGVHKTVLEIPKIRKSLRKTTKNLHQQINSINSKEFTIAGFLENNARSFNQIFTYLYGHELDFSSDRTMIASCEKLARWEFIRDNCKLSIIWCKLADVLQSESGQSENESTWSDVDNQSLIIDLCTIYDKLCRNFDQRLRKVLLNGAEMRNNLFCYQALKTNYHDEASFIIPGSQQIFCSAKLLIGLLEPGVTLLQIKEQVPFAFKIIQNICGKVAKEYIDAKQSQLIDQNIQQGMVKNILLESLQITMWLFLTSQNKMGLNSMLKKCCGDEALRDICLKNFFCDKKERMENFKVDKKSGEIKFVKSSDKFNIIGIVNKTFLERKIKDLGRMFSKRNSRNQDPRVAVFSGLYKHVVKEKRLFERIMNKLLFCWGFARITESYRLLQEVCQSIGLPFVAKKNNKKIIHTLSLNHFDIISDLEDAKLYGDWQTQLLAKYVNQFVQELMGRHQDSSLQQPLCFFQSRNRPVCCVVEAKGRKHLVELKLDFSNEFNLYEVYKYLYGRLSSFPEQLNKGLISKLDLPDEYKVNGIKECREYLLNVIPLKLGCVDLKSFSIDKHKFSNVRLIEALGAHNTLTILKFWAEHKKQNLCVWGYEEKYGESKDVEILHENKGGGEKCVLFWDGKDFKRVLEVSTEIQKLTGERSFQFKHM